MSRDRSSGYSFSRRTAVFDGGDWRETRRPPRAQFFFISGRAEFAGLAGFLAFSTGLGIGLLTGGYDELFSICPVPGDGGTY
jgi:hypothetical protein